MRNLIMSLVLILPFYVFGQTRQSIDTFHFSVIEILDNIDTLSVDTFNFKSKIVFNRVENLLIIENPLTFKNESYFLNLHFDVSYNDDLLEIYNDTNSNKRFYIYYTNIDNGKTISEFTIFEPLVTKEVPYTLFVEEYGIVSNYK
jgi:hypothetical protein